MTIQAVACISTAALQHNLNVVREKAPNAKVLAVVKANGYGHGADLIANALSSTDAFAVGTIDEAELLRSCTDKTIVILQGVQDEASLALCFQHGYGIVVHSEHQLKLLEAVNSDAQISVWLKIDTGMHRLGFDRYNAVAVYKRLRSLKQVKAIIIMSHLACADEPQRMENQYQLDNFKALVEFTKSEYSLCNSAGLISFPDSQHDWVRPGIMLYGISPLKNKTAEALNLHAAMTLKSQIIALNTCKPGDKIGYGATYTCEKEMCVGVIGFGYGDGYPRHAATGTPVLISGQRVPIVGRVSMDMITVDVSDISNISIGDEVTLWGDGLPIEEIAEAADTIGYELVCRLTSRVRYQQVA